MPAPAAPANFRVLNRGIDSGPEGLAKVRLGWDEVDGASYRIQRVSGTSVLADAFAVPGELNVIFRGLPVSSACSFRLRSESAGGVSAWVEVAAITAARSTAASMSAPTGLTVSVHKRYVTLSWTDNSGAADYFMIGFDGLTPWYPGFTERAATELCNSVTFDLALPVGSHILRVLTAGGTDYGTGVASAPIGATTNTTDLTLIASNRSVTAGLDVQGLPVRAWRGFPIGGLYYRGANVIPATYSADGLPAGLSLTHTSLTYVPHAAPSDAAIVEGTTSAPAGIYSITIHGDDGAGHTDSVLRYLRLTEPDGVFDLSTGLTAIDVIADEYFGATLRFNPPLMRGSFEAYTLTALTLPSGVSLSHNGESSTNHALTGRLPAGTYNIAMTASHGGASVNCVFTVRSRAPLSGPDKISGWVGDELLQLFGYTGACTVKQWFLCGGPPGLEPTVVVPCDDTPYGEDNKIYTALAGIPTLPGIFPATVSALVCCSGISRLVSRAIDFTISGGLFLGWLHADPNIRDLQVMMYSREVLSYAWAGGVWLKMGDRARLRIVFRNGPLPRGLPKVTTSEDGSITTTQESEANYGRDLVDADRFTQLWLTIRQKSGDADELVLLEKGSSSSPPTVTIGGHSVFALEFDVASDNLHAAMERAARATGEPQAAVSLPCLGEISWVRDGVTESSLNFDLTIHRDLRR